MYLATGTRPDITFPVCNVAKFCSDPTKCHWTAIKQIEVYTCTLRAHLILVLCVLGVMDMIVLAIQILIGSVIYVIGGSFWLHIHVEWCWD